MANLATFLQGVSFAKYYMQVPEGLLFANLLMNDITFNFIKNLCTLSAMCTLSAIEKLSAKKRL